MAGHDGQSSAYLSIKNDVIIMTPKIGRRALLKALGGGTVAACTLQLLGLFQSNAIGQTAQPLQGDLPDYLKKIADTRLVVFLPQGGLDGLHFLSPYGDPDYHEFRKELALSSEANEPYGLPLDPLFALHPAVAPALHELWRQEEMILFPSIASLYRGHAHQEARFIMQSGMPSGDLATGQTGWLGRALETFIPYLPQPIQGDLGLFQEKEPLFMLNPETVVEEKAIIHFDNLVAQQIQGDADFTKAMAELQIFQNETQGRLGASHDLGRISVMDAHALVGAVENLAPTLLNDHGARILVLAAHGFDSHSQQGTLEGELAQNMACLAEAIRRTRQILDPVWDRTHILMINEFGRSLRPNQQNGTDHGLGGLALLAGGKVRGKQIVGNWPGLTLSEETPFTDDEGEIIEHSGLIPTLDSRSLFKAMAAEIWKMDEAQIAQLFPGSFDVYPLSGVYS